MRRGLIVVGVLLVIALAVFGFRTYRPAESARELHGAESTTGALSREMATVSNESSNTVTFDGQVYALSVLEPCGIGSDGQLHLVAVTVNDYGSVQPGGPQFSVQSGPWETTAYFFAGSGEVRALSQRGNKRMTLDAGRLRIDGRTDGVDAGAMSVDLACP